MAYKIRRILHDLNAFDYRRIPELCQVESQFSTVQISGKKTSKNWSGAVFLFIFERETISSTRQPVNGAEPKEGNKKEMASSHLLY